MKYILLLFNLSFLLSGPLKLDEVESFLNAKYEGDTSAVISFISDEFQYLNTPYVGLGIKAFYIDGSLLVTELINESIRNQISIGDRIYEFNNKVVTPDGFFTKGPVGQIQKLLLTKMNDTLFTEIKIPLSMQQQKENSESYLNSIIEYSKIWYEYDIIIHDYFSKKDKVFVHYSWEGSKEENSEVYHFTIIEILTLEKKTGLIKKIESLWSEYQFRNQFK